MDTTVSAGGIVQVQMTEEQSRMLGHAIRLWNDPGESVVAKMQPNGHLLLGTCCAGTWSFLHVGRDGMAVGPWF